MARVSGPGLDPKAKYRAVPSAGRGIYLLALDDSGPGEHDGSVTVRISQAAIRRIGRHKLQGETLAQAVERLALSSLLSKKPDVE